MKGGILRSVLLIVGTFLLLVRYLDPVNGIMLLLGTLDLLTRFLIFAVCSFSKLRLLRFGLFLLAYSKVFSLFSHPLCNFVESGIGVAGAFVCAIDLLLFLKDDLHRQLLDVTVNDSLTGLLNRHCFMVRTRRLLKELEARNQRAVMIFLDLNKFKLVNDRHGHRMGDKVLEILGKRLKNAVKESDLVGRLGGDEFAVFVQNASRVQAQQIVRRICESISTPIFVDNEVFNIGVSAGVAVYPEDGKTLEELIEKADKEMYRVKYNIVTEGYAPQNE